MWCAFSACHSSSLFVVCASCARVASQHVRVGTHLHAYCTLFVCNQNMQYLWPTRRWRTHSLHTRADLASRVVGAASIYWGTYHLYLTGGREFAAIPETRELYRCVARASPQWLRSGPLYSPFALDLAMRDTHVFILHFHPLPSSRYTPLILSGHLHRCAPHTRPARALTTG